MSKNVFFTGLSRSEDKKIHTKKSGFCIWKAASIKLTNGAEILYLRISFFTLSRNHCDGCFCVARESQRNIFRSLTLSPPFWIANLKPSSWWRFDINRVSCHGSWKKRFCRIKKMFISAKIRLAFLSYLILSLSLPYQYSRSDSLDLLVGFVRPLKTVLDRPTQRLMLTRKERAFDLDP